MMTDKQTSHNIDEKPLPSGAIEKIEGLLNAVPPRELRENLLEIYHTYLIYVHDTLPLGFERIALNMYLLINCLRDVDRDNVDGQVKPTDL